MLQDSMLLEYLPTFTQTKSPSHVGKYTSTMEHMGFENWMIQRLNKQTWWKGEASDLVRLSHQKMVNEIEPAEMGLRAKRLNQPVYDYKTEICEYVHGIHCSKLRSYLGVAAENWMYCNPQFALVIEKTCGNDYKPWDLGVPCDQGRICHRTTVSSIPKKPLGLPWNRENVSPAVGQQPKSGWYFRCFKVTKEIILAVNHSRWYPCHKPPSGQSTRGILCISVPAFGRLLHHTSYGVSAHLVVVPSPRGPLKAPWGPKHWPLGW